MQGFGFRAYGFGLRLVTCGKPGPVNCGIELSGGHRSQVFGSLPLINLSRGLGFGRPEYLGRRKSARESVCGRYRVHEREFGRKRVCTSERVGEIECTSECVRKK